MSAGKSQSQPWNQIFLGLLAIILLSAAIFEPGKDIPDAVAIFVIITGAGLAILAAFWSRVHGKIGLTKDGFGVDIAAAEKSLSEGDVVDADNVDKALKAAKDALSEYTPNSIARSQEAVVSTRAADNTLATSTIPPIDLTDSPNPRSKPISTSTPDGSQRTVQLVEDAVLQLGTLTFMERHQVQHAIDAMRLPDFDDSTDNELRGDSKLVYRARPVPGTDIRILYRPLRNEDDDSLVILSIAKHRE